MHPQRRELDVQVGFEIILAKPVVGDDALRRVVASIHCIEMAGMARGKDVFACMRRKVTRIA